MPEDPLAVTSGPSEPPPVSSAPDPPRPGLLDWMREAARAAVAGKAIWLVVGRVLGAAFAAAWLLVAARALQPTRFGVVVVIIGLGTLVGVFTEGGLPLLVVEAIGTDPSAARSVVARTLMVRLPLSLLGALAMVSVAGLLYPAGFVVAGLYGLSLLASAAQTTVGSALRASGHVVAEAVSEAGGRLLVLVAGIVMIRLSPTGASVTGAYLVGGTITTAALCGHAWMRLPQRPPLDSGNAPVRWAIPFRRAVHLGVAAMLVTAYNRIDLWLLAALASSRSAGLYAAAYRFFEGTILPATAFGALLVPVAAKTAQGARRGAVLMYLGAAVGLTATAAAVVFVFARPLVLALLGDSFSSSATPLRLLSLAAIPTAAFGVISPLASLGHRRAGVNLLLIGMAVNAAVNLALIPSLGATGAATAEIVSQSVLALLFWRALTGSIDATSRSPASGL